MFDSEIPDQSSAYARSEKLILIQVGGLVVDGVEQISLEESNAPAVCDCDIESSAEGFDESEIRGLTFGSHVLGTHHDVREGRERSAMESESRSNQVGVS